MFDVTAQCMVRTRVFASSGSIAGLAAATDRNVPVVSADSAALPFAAGAFDGVLLHHALESAPDARTALREAARVLRVGGLLVVAGFNPLSSWLFTKPLPAFRALKPVSVPRLRDWLALLGLVADHKPFYTSVPKPWSWAAKRGSVAAGESRQRSTHWWHRMPTGGVYFVSATKVAQGFIAPPLRCRESGEFAGTAPHPVARVRPAA